MREPYGAQAPDVFARIADLCKALGLARIGIVRHDRAVYEASRYEAFIDSHPNVTDRRSEFGATPHEALDALIGKHTRTVTKLSLV